MTSKKASAVNRVQDLDITPLEMLLDTTKIPKIKMVKRNRSQKFWNHFAQAFIISISLPTLLKKIWGPLPFWAVFVAIEQFKIVIFIVCGIGNVSAVMQLLLIINFE